MRLVLILALIFSNVTFAQEGDARGQLRSLIEKDVKNKMTGGKGLSESELKLYNKLSEKVGLFESNQITQDVMKNIADGTESTKPIEAEKEFELPPPSKTQVKAKLVDKTEQDKSQTVTKKEKKEDPKKEEKPQVLTIVVQQAPQSTPTPATVIVPQSEDEPKKEVAPKIDKKLESKMASAFNRGLTRSETESVSERALIINETKGDEIYQPSPLGESLKNQNFIVERDASSVVTYSVSVSDAITIRNCVADGVSIHLDESIKTNLQSAIISDDKYFSVKEFENKRGVFVRLTRPIKESEAWISALRLVRKDDDKVYLINLIGESCPEDGVLRFPKIVYLTERVNRNTRLDDKLKLSDNEILTPEDTIIEFSKGYDRTDAYKIQVYDMVSSAGSGAASIGVELRSLTLPEDGEFQVLDFHQVTKVKTTSRYLELQSKKASTLRGIKVQRWNLTVSLNKDYVLRRGYIYLMYVNNKKKNYEYVMVDLRKYLRSLKEREFDL